MLTASLRPSRCSPDAGGASLCPGGVNHFPQQVSSHLLCQAVLQALRLQ